MPRSTHTRPQSSELRSHREPVTPPQVASLRNTCAYTARHRSPDMEIVINSPHLELRFPEDVCVKVPVFTTKDSIGGTISLNPDTCPSTSKAKLTVAVSLSAIAMHQRRTEQYTDRTSSSSWKALSTGPRVLLFRPSLLYPQSHRSARCLEVRRHHLPFPPLVRNTSMSSSTLRWTSLFRKGRRRLRYPIAITLSKPLPPFDGGCLMARPTQDIGGRCLLEME